MKRGGRDKPRWEKLTPKTPEKLEPQKPQKRQPKKSLSKNPLVQHKKQHCNIAQTKQSTETIHSQ